MHLFSSFVTFFKKFGFAEDVRSVAEAASNLKLAGFALGFLLVEELFYVLFAERGNSVEHSFARAGAFVFDFIFVENIVFDVLERDVGDLLKGKSLLKEAGYVREGGSVSFYLRNDLFVREGKKLDHNAACGEAGKVAVNEHSERAESGKLFAFGIVARDVLGNLARGDRDRATVRLAVAVVADYGEKSLSDRTANVKLADRVERELNVGIGDISANASEPIGYRENSARRAVARESEREGVLLLAHHNSHKGSGGEKSAEKGGTGGAGGKTGTGGAVFMARK